LDKLGRPFITVDRVGYGTKYFRSCVVVLKKDDKGKIAFTNGLTTQKNLSSWIKAEGFRWF